MATRDGLSIHINAHKFAGMLVAIVRSHQVPMVLFGPSQGTLVGCRDHHFGTTWPDVTHGARSILVVKIFAKAWEIAWLILCAAYRAGSLPALDILVINRVVGKTNKIRASTGVSIITAAHRTCQNTGKIAFKSVCVVKGITFDCPVKLWSSPDRNEAVSMNNLNYHDPRGEGGGKGGIIRISSDEDKILDSGIFLGRKIWQVFFRVVWFN